MEVILAIGILSLTILALLGLFGPTLSSAEAVMHKNAAQGVMAAVNAFLQTNASAIGPRLPDRATIVIPESEQANFNNVSTWARNGHVLYVWHTQQWDSNSNKLESLDINIGSDIAEVRYDFNANDKHIEGSVFVVLLCQNNSNLNYPYFANADEGYIPIKVAIYAVASDRVANSDLFAVVANSHGLDENESYGISVANLLMTYSTAKVR